MKYTQKDICRLLNITRETLRFYEKEGIISPEVNPDNRYRFYDDYQMYLISECKRYQTNGFSIEEIRRMLTEDNLERYVGRIAVRQKEIARQAEKLFWANELMADYLQRLRMIPENLHRIEEKWLEDIIFVSQRQGKHLRLDEESITVSRKLMNQLQLTFMMAYCPDIAENTCEWGFGIRSWMADKGMDEIEGGREIVSGKVLTYVDDAGSASEFDPSIAAPLIREAEKRGLKPDGRCILIQLVRIHEDDGIHRYFEVYLPVL